MQFLPISGVQVLKGLRFEELESFEDLREPPKSRIPEMCGPNYHFGDKIKRFEWLKSYKEKRYKGKFSFAFRSHNIHDDHDFKKVHFKL